ncbi:MAG: SemiSWEET family sugar transporter [Prochlorococcus sp.]
MFSLAFSGTWLACMERFSTTDIIGYLAATLTTISFLPQLIKIWKTKSAEDVSTGMFVFFVCGVLLWIVYGWEIHSPPVITANIVTCLLASMILVLKLVFRPKPD